MKRRNLLWKSVFVAALLAALVFSDWLVLGYRALGYPVTAPGQASNIVVRNDYAYVALAEAGIGIYELASGRLVETLSPAEAGGSVDDLDVSDGLLFALDARIPGALTVYSLGDPKKPRRVAGPVPVEVGPFSGVSAAAGRVIVSGGTSHLTLRRYDPRGNLSTEFTATDLGRGQPDALLRPDGRAAAVSTHFTGPKFGLATLDLRGTEPQLAGTLPLPEAGFTEGGSKPANFPIEGAWAGKSLLLAQGNTLAVVDLSDLSRPHLQRRLDLGVHPVNVDVAEGLVAAVGSFPRELLVLFELGEDGTPRRMRRLSLPEGSRPTGVAIGSDRIAVATQEGGVLFFQR